MSDEPKDQTAAPPLTWSNVMGLRLLRANADEVVAELEIEAIHLQGFGIVHGGVYAGIIESVASAGASVVAKPRGQIVAGIENHTSFIRTVGSGRIRVRATPITRGERTQVWEATVRDAEDRILATGRVRLICMDASTEHQLPVEPTRDDTSF